MYRIKDPLENLLLRVRLRKVNVIKKTDTDQDDIEELTFKWQEKYFSIIEKELYKAAEMNSPLHNHYSSLLAKTERNINKRLFTYTSQDHYHPKNEPEITVKKKGKSRQTMYIMADLQSIENGPHFDEQMLLTITVDSDGVMTLSCDLTNDGKVWYRIESSQREIFEYQLFNDSQPITSQELKQEKELHYKLQARQRERLWSSIGEHFEPLPTEKASRYIHVFGCIERSEGFSDTPLYITLKLHPLNDVHGSDGTVVTQLCSPNSNNEAFFNCPFEYIFLYTETTPTQTTPPCIILSYQVWSLDYWDRHRIEGSATCHIPMTPGSRTMCVSTCRPHPSSLKEQLMRYFIGSPPLYERGEEEEERGKSLFGMQTVSSGKITFKVNTIHHSHECADKFEHSETLRAEPKLYTLLKASDAYRKARSNALQLLNTQQL